MADEFVDLVGWKEAAHAPGGEGLVVGGDEKDVRDALEIGEVGREEAGAGDEDRGEKEGGGADDHAGGGAVAAGEEPVEDEDAGSDFDGGGEGEEGSGGEGPAALGEKEAGDGEEEIEDVGLHEHHGVAEGLGAGEEEEDDGEGDGVEQAGSPEAGDEIGDADETEQAEGLEEDVEGGETQGGAEGAKTPGPERGLDVGVEVADKAGGVGLPVPGGVVGVDFGKGFRVVAVEVVGVAGGEDAAADVGGGEVVAGCGKIAGKAKEEEDDENLDDAGVVRGRAAEETQLHWISSTC